MDRDCAGDVRPKPDADERFVGSMLAGTLGDALGYAIEFCDIDMIRRTHGEDGLTEPVLRHGAAQVSDDTQIMLCTDSDPIPGVQHAYQRWFHTQNQPWERAAGPYSQRLPEPDGWLITKSEMFTQRAPGGTCMSALLSVNHSGDSDSTGMVCGNIVGPCTGSGAIGVAWLGTLELHEIVRGNVQDALAEFSPTPPAEVSWTRRYPAW